MEINGKAHLFFEQSGTFKNEFIKLGIPAEDYDIQNNFGSTDHVVDLFKAIEDAYNDNPSIFDNISNNDLIIAFFPCIYFCEKSQWAMTYNYIHYRGKSKAEKIRAIMSRYQNREYFYSTLLKLFYIVEYRGLRMIVENPYHPQNYLLLSNNFLTKPTIVDKNRMLRGDFFIKPTAYWFVNCVPTFGKTVQFDKKQKRVSDCRSSRKAGICSEERSMISHDYARNFIYDFILGKSQPEIDPQLF